MKSKVIKVYDYRDASGEIVSQTVRLEPKAFRQRRPLNGHFAWGLKAGWYEKRPTGEDYQYIKEASAKPQEAPHENAIYLPDTKLILYKLSEITKGIEKGETLIICEGEKDADNIYTIGYIGTTCPMGASKWQSSYTEALKGCKNVVIIPDKDTPGRKHSALVAKELADVGISVKIIEMPDRNGTKVKDFSDWLDSGGTKEEFDQLVANAPLWVSQNKESGNVSNDLILRYGQPYYLNRYGEAVAVNESYQAALYCAENIIFYDPVEKAFNRYDYKTGLYIEISENRIKKELADRILKISREQNIPSLERLKKNAILTNIIGQLKGISERPNAFVKQFNFIHFKNGILIFNNTNNADFVSFAPTFFSRNQCPIHYDPTAKCDRFINELLYLAVCKEDAILIQKYCGLCLVGINHIQRVLILCGLGGRSKTTIALIIQMIVGLNNVTELRTQHLAGRFELYRYLRKFLLVGVDVPGDFLSQKGVSIIKGLVGGDYFDAEQKNNIGSFQLQGNRCILITSNSRLQIKLDGDIGAWRRRLLIVRFEGPAPEKKIPNFAEQLIKEEGPGILNWAIDGLAMVLDDIRQYGEIRLGDRQLEIVDALLAESDSIRNFLKDCVVADEFSDLSVSEIIEAYAEYCPKKGWNPKPITIVQREIDGLMLELFHTAKAHSLIRDGKTARGFRRVGFKDGEIAL